MGRLGQYLVLLSSPRCHFFNYIVIKADLSFDCYDSLMQLLGGRNRVPKVLDLGIVFGSDVRFSQRAVVKHCDTKKKHLDESAQQGFCWCVETGKGQTPDR